MRMHIHIYSGWILPYILYPCFVAFSISTQICMFVFSFLKDYFVFGSAGLCLLCRLFLCGLLSAVALVVEHGHCGVWASVAAAHGLNSCDT